MNIQSRVHNLSVIIPTLDEADNIKKLVTRLATTLRDCTNEFELIFIDDFSTDKTVNQINKLATLFPVRVYQKDGRKGKSFSLIQGFKLAKYELLAMIDADLQYPPEALAEMLNKISIENADIVLTRRNKYYEDHLRSFGSGFNNYLNRHLFGFNYDVQSGLKLFTKDIYQKMNFKKVGPWTFDMLFLTQAKQLNSNIAVVDIKFDTRLYGQSKVNFIKVGFEILFYTIKLYVGHLLKKLWTREFIKFSMFGVLNTLIDIGIYFILIRSFHFFMINFILAKAISYTVASINSFIFNRRFTFRSQNTSWLFVLPFMAAGIVGLLINTGILAFLVKVVDLNQIYSVFIATLVVLTYNFTISKFYIFSKYRTTK